VQNIVNRRTEPEFLRQYEYITLKEVLVASFSHSEKGYSSCTIIRALLTSFVSALLYSLVNLETLTTHSRYNRICLEQNALRESVRLNHKQLILIPTVTKSEV
jgi:hypothetical protein